MLHCAQKVVDPVADGAEGDVRALNNASDKGHSVVGHPIERISVTHSTPRLIDCRSSLSLPLSHGLYVQGALLNASAY